MQIKETSYDGIPCLQVKGESLQFLICPAAGGKIVELYHNSSNENFLWKNPNLSLSVLPYGTAYDPNFFGGMDELLPNDEAENIGELDYPDHGELWTSLLNWSANDDGLTLKGVLPHTGFSYSKTISLENNFLHQDYLITNIRHCPNPFLFKMHAALSLTPGDTLICSAAMGEIADEEFTNRHGQRYFQWPLWKDERLDTVLGADSKKCEFFYLSELSEGIFTLQSTHQNRYFTYHFDTTVFPYAWYFASYGGWDGLYTGILEPATAIPTALSQSIQNNTCPLLQPGESLKTRVSVECGLL